MSYFEKIVGVTKNSTQYCLNTKKYLRLRQICFKSLYNKNQTIRLHFDFKNELNVVKYSFL